jgi:hypothetical protein
VAPETQFRVPEPVGTAVGSQRLKTGLEFAHTLFSPFFVERVPLSHIKAALKTRRLGCSRFTSGALDKTPDIALQTGDLLVQIYPE